MSGREMFMFDPKMVAQEVRDLLAGRNIGRMQ